MSPPAPVLSGVVNKAAWAARRRAPTSSTGEGGVLVLAPDRLADKQKATQPCAPRSRRCSLTIAEIHGNQATCSAMDDGLELQAFSAEYIANILAEADDRGLFAHTLRNCL